MTLNRHEKGHTPLPEVHVTKLHVYIIDDNDLDWTLFMRMSHLKTKGVMLDYSWSSQKRKILNMHYNSSFSLPITKPSTKTFRIINLLILSDSQLTVNKVVESYQAKEQWMTVYLRRREARIWAGSRVGMETRNIRPSITVRLGSNKIKIYII